MNSHNYYYDYEFDFVNGVFDQYIYDLCTIPDPSGTRLEVIKTTLDNIVKIFVGVPGFHIFSTFVQLDDKYYKITTNNAHWIHKAEEQHQ